MPVSVTKNAEHTTEHLSRRELRSERLKALGRRAPSIVQAGATIGAAIGQMQANHGDCLLVCSDDRLVGILTERDILRKVLGRGIDLDSLVDGFMTPDPDTLTVEATLEDALKLMERGGYRNVPLVDGSGRLEGVLRQQDILEFVAEAFPQEILNLPPRPHQVMEQAEGG